MHIQTQTAELQEVKYNITVDKRLRMTWETEVTVTVMMERAERMQRSIEEQQWQRQQEQQDEEGLEGRFYWIRGRVSLRRERDTDDRMGPRVAGNICYSPSRFLSD